MFAILWRLWCGTRGEFETVQQDIDVVEAFDRFTTHRQHVCQWAHIHLAECVLDKFTRNSMCKWVLRSGSFFVTDMCYVFSLCNPHTRLFSE